MSKQQQLEDKLDSVMRSLESVVAKLTWRNHQNYFILFYYRACNIVVELDPVTSKPMCLMAKHQQKASTVHVYDHLLCWKRNIQQGAPYRKSLNWRSAQCTPSSTCFLEICRKSGIRSHYLKSVSPTRRSDPLSCRRKSGINIWF